MKANFLGEKWLLQPESMIQHLGKSSLLLAMLAESLAIIALEYTSTLSFARPASLNSVTIAPFSFNFFSLYSSLSDCGAGHFCHMCPVLPHAQQDCFANLVPRSSLSHSVTTDGLLRHNSHEPRRQILTLSHDMPLMPTCHTISDAGCHRNIQLWQLAV